jgi:PIN domain nuclease of toxin-antitoxin system
LLAAGALAPHHADSFDRMLVARAPIENSVPEGNDVKVALYDVPLYNVPLFDPG